MYKHEIERRLNKADYTKVPQLIALEANYSDITSNVDLIKILNIADKYGQKYIQFYKLKVSADINTLLSNLTTKSYSPNIPHTAAFTPLCIAMLKKDPSQKTFSIIANNYTTHKQWQNTSDTKRELITVHTRRVIYIEYDNTNKILTFTQDPIGEGAGISTDIPAFIKTIFTDNYQINFNDYFELLDLQANICNLIDEGIFTTTKVKGVDNTTGRLHETIGKNSVDNLQDDAVYLDIRNNNYTVERIRLKHKDISKGTFEVFYGNILRVWFKINWSQSDVIKNSITPLL